MPKYHINPANGNPGPCSAQQGRCPFGGDLEHFDTEDDARKAYERAMAKTPWPSTVGEPSDAVLAHRQANAEEIVAKTAHLFEKEEVETVEFPLTSSNGTEFLVRVRRDQARRRTPSGRLSKKYEWVTYYSFDRPGDKPNLRFGLGVGTAQDAEAGGKLLAEAIEPHRPAGKNDHHNGYVAKLTNFGN